MGPEVILSGTIIGTTEFIKRVLTRLNVSVTGEVTIVIAVVVGATLTFFGLPGTEGISPLAGAIIGAAAVGGVTIVDRVRGK